jgi:hypothetical protein
MRRRTLIGAVRSIDLNMETICGGAVERGILMLQDAKLRNIQQKTIKMMMKIKITLLESKSGACAAKNMGTLPPNAQKIPTLELEMY